MNLLCIEVALAARKVLFFLPWCVGPFVDFVGNFSLSDATKWVAEMILVRVPRVLVAKRTRTDVDWCVSQTSPKLKIATHVLPRTDRLFFASVVVRRDCYIQEFFRHHPVSRNFRTNRYGITIRRRGWCHHIGVCVGIFLVFLLQNCNVPEPSQQRQYSRSHPKLTTRLPEQPLPNTTNTWQVLCSQSSKTKSRWIEK